MSLDMVLAGVLATALLGGSLAPRVVDDHESAREPRPYTVRASLESHRVVEDEGFVHVEGRIFPKVIGEKVTLQQRVGSRPWKTTDQAMTRSGGRFWLSDMPRTPGVRYYRVVKPASRGVGAGASKSLRVVVLDYEWMSLLGRHVALQNVSTLPVDIGGTPRDGGLTLIDPSQPGYAEFGLGGRCEVVDVGAGMAKTSASGSVGWAYLHQDGDEDITEVYRSEDSSDGPSFYSGVSVAGAGRVRIEVGATPTPPGYPSVFRLRAFCAS